MRKAIGAALLTLGLSTHADETAPLTGRGVRGHALLDTGSAAIGWGVLSAAQWKRATGGAPQAAGGPVRGFEISAWERRHRCYAAPARIRLQAGRRTLAAPTVTFCPTLDFHPPEPLEGILGLSPFKDSVLTIDYVSGRWLVETARPIEAR